MSRVERLFNSATTPHHIRDRWEISGAVGTVGTTKARAAAKAERIRLKFFDYNAALTNYHCLTTEDPTKLEQVIRDEASNLYEITLDRLERDLDKVREKRRKAKVNNALTALALKFSPEAQRLLQHPFLKST